MRVGLKSFRRLPWAVTPKSTHLFTLFFQLRQHIFEIMFSLWKGWRDWTGHSCTVRKWRLTGQRAHSRANTGGQQMKYLEMFVRVSPLPHYIRGAALSPKIKAKDNIQHC